MTVGNPPLDYWFEVELRECEDDDGEGISQWQEYYFYLRWYNRRIHYIGHFEPDESNYYRSTIIQAIRELAAKHQIDISAVDFSAHNWPEQLKEITWNGNRSANLV